MKGKTTMRKLAGMMMAALMTLGVQTAKAQSPTFHLGGMLVPQFTNFTSNIGTYSGAIGFQGGLAAELRFTPNFSAEMDLLYSMHNVNRAYIDSVIATGYYSLYNTYNTVEHANYLQVPLLLKLNIPLTGKRIIPYDAPNNNPTSISIFAGPHFSYLLNYSRTGTINVTMIDQVSGEALSNQTSVATMTPKDLEGVYKIDFGITAGVGVNFGIGEKSTLSFEGRFSKGFNPLDKGYFGTYTYALVDGVDWLNYTYAQIYNTQLGLAIVFKGQL
jgi:hypothetical protein